MLRIKLRGKCNVFKVFPEPFPSHVLSLANYPQYSHLFLNVLVFNGSKGENVKNEEGWAKRLLTL